MNKTTDYTGVITTNIPKVTLTINRMQLWQNYVRCFADVAWESPDTDLSDVFNSVYRVMCHDGVLGSSLRTELRKLFRDGNTVALLGDGMQHFDKCGIVREIVVTDVDGSQITIEHSDIVF